MTRTHRRFHGIVWPLLLAALIAGLALARAAKPADTDPVGRVLPELTP